MNKLQIAQLINTLAGTQGTVDTTEGTSGYQATLVEFLDQAYNDIQIFRESWKFMQGTVDIPLNIALNTFSSDDIAKGTRIIYDKRVLKEIPYEVWVLRDHPANKPVEWTVNPYTDELEFNTLDGTYIVTLQYQKVPDELTSNLDTPLLPKRFHGIIAYKALIGLGSYLGNYDLITKYSNKYSIELGALMRSQVPVKFLTTKPLV